MFFNKRDEAPDRLNICIVSRRFFSSGPFARQSYFWPIAQELSKKGHIVTIITETKPGNMARFDGLGIKLVFIEDPRPNRGSNYFTRNLLRKFTELHKEEPFHIVHGLDATAFTIGAHKKQFKTAIVYDVECTQMSQIFSLLGMAQDSLPNMISTGISVGYKFLSTFLAHDRKLLKTADGIIVTTPRQQIVLERYYLYPELKTYQIPYGLEPLDLDTTERSEELRKELGLNESAKIVVTISDMTEKFEIINIMRAFQKVCIKKSSARLIIIGQGPYFKNIEYEMLSLALGSKVILTGAVPESDLPAYIGMSNVFVNLSSRTTGLDPSLMAAMALKKTIIGSEVNAISMVVEDSIDGFLIRPADYQELSELLINIFSNQIPVREVGEKAREKVNNLYNLEKMVNETINSYYDILVRSKKYLPISQHSLLESTANH